MLAIIPLPALKDNYIWLLRDGPFAVVVDPGDAAPVLRYLKRHRLTMVAILITHRHGDHTAGTRQLRAFAHVPVYGPRSASIPDVTNPVGEGDIVIIPELSLQLSVADMPGHTTEHIAYYGADWLFCGDTLFGCGCGRVESTAAQLYASLNKLAALPDATQVYCGHEYTLANIGFAQTVDPNNQALIQRKLIESRKISEGLATLPSSIGLEKQTNPFLRCDKPEIRQAAENFSAHTLSDAISVFAALRAWKNIFKE